MQRLIVIILCIALLVSIGNAANIRYKASGPWEDVDPDGSADHGWQNATVPTEADTARANWGGGTITLDYETTTGKFQAGVDESGTFHILEGGILNTAIGNSKIGNNNDCTGTMIIDAGGVVNSTGWLMIAGNSIVKGEAYVGGVLNSEGHLWMATGSDSVATLDIYDGGEVNVGQNIGLGTVNANDPSGGVATINVHGGVLDLYQWSNTGSIQDGSVIDIEFGTVIVGGNRVNAAEDYAAAGKITAFGGESTLNIVYDSGTNKTTITANDPFEAYPAMGQEDIYYEGVELSWKNKEPNWIGATDPKVTVWFGQVEEGETEPNKAGGLYTKVLENEPWSEYMSVAVDTPVAGTYYWQVELVDSFLDAPDSRIYHFTTTDNAPPTVDAGADIVSWAGKETPLNATITDEGTANISWSADPSAGVTFSSTIISNPTVTVDSAGSVVLTVTADDGFNDPVSDTVVLSVYEDACQAAREGAGLDEEYPGDFDGDCIIELEDFAAEIAPGWLDNYALTAPVAK